MVNSCGLNDGMGRGFARGGFLRAVFLGKIVLLLGVCVALLPADAAEPSEAPGGIPDGTKTADPKAQAVVQQYMAGPSVFIQNMGQWGEDSILFALDGSGANVGLTAQGPKFQLFRRKAEPEKEPDPSDPTRSDKGLQPLASSDQMDPALERSAPPPSEMVEFGVVFDGAAQVTPVGRDKSERTFNYLMGDVANHRQGVPSFNSVWYEGLYPGVDLEVTGRRTGIKYNFHVAPGADFKAIHVKYTGIKELSLRSDGTLEIQIAKDWQPLMDGAPEIYQEINGEKVRVSGMFVMVDSHTYRFDVTGTYDADLPFVIDPFIQWNADLDEMGDTGCRR